MIYDPFDVVVVPFPFTDREAERRRPALIVSSPEFNVAHEQSILAMITSAESDWPSDVALRSWRDAGLAVPCKVRLKLFTVDDTSILRKAGTLSRGDAEAVARSLFRFLAIDDAGFVGSGTTPASMRWS